MITFLNGKMAEKQPTRIVLDVNGVGYEILIPLSCHDQLPSKDEICHILTYDYIREDRHQLFGFMTEEERQMFCQLMSISGIGPKLALSALSGLSVRELKTAVLSGDVKRISSISGIGPKVAERIVVELKHKIDDADAFEAIAGAEGVSAETTKMHDAVLALIALGYKQSAAQKMINDVLKKSDDKDVPVEEIIKKALSS